MTGVRKDNNFSNKYISVCLQCSDKKTIEKLRVSVYLNLGKNIGKFG